MYLNDTASQITDDGIRVLLRAVNRYHIASLQDANLYVAAKHNGYAVGAIGLLMHLASPEAIKAAGGDDAVMLRREVLGVQDKHEGEAMKLLEKMKAKGFDPMKFDIEKVEKLVARL